MAHPSAAKNGINGVASGPTANGARGGKQYWAEGVWQTGRTGEFGPASGLFHPFSFLFLFLFSFLISNPIQTMFNF
jgi:hypothetical protein